MVAAVAHSFLFRHPGASTAMRVLDRVASVAGQCPRATKSVRSVRSHVIPRHPTSSHVIKGDEVRQVRQVLTEDVWLVMRSELGARDEVCMFPTSSAAKASTKKSSARVEGRCTSLVDNLVGAGAVDERGESSVGSQPLPDRITVKTMKPAELKAELRSRGLGSHGTKKVLLARLLEALSVGTE